MKNVEVVKKKYPKSNVILLVAAYIVPILFMGLYAVSAGRVTPGVHAKIVAHRAMIIYQIVHICITAGGIIYTVKIFNQLGSTEDVTEEGQKKMALAWRLINYGQIFYLVFGGVMYGVSYCIAAERMGIHTVHLPSYLMVWLGAVLMWDMMFYIIWLERTEAWMDFVPFSKKNMAMNLFMRYATVACFAAVSMALVCCGPVLYPGYEGQSSQQMFMHVFPMAGLGVILLIVDFMLLLSPTLKNIRNFNTFSQNLAEGDYTQDTLQVVSRDDMGILVNSMNQFYGHTKNLLSNLQGSVASSNQAAEASAESMQNITSSVNQIVSNIEGIQGQMQGQSSGVEEAVSVINEIAGNIDGLNEVVAKQVTAVEESSAAIHEMVANIQSVTTILDKNSASTEELAKASEEGRSGVKKAVELADAILNDSKGLIEASNVVQNIASQTNLLAMNAAIEAAHAGESGKGFAVVADEIRKLAEQSNVQGKRITESLNALENSIQGVSGSTRELNNQFDRIFELTKVVRQQEVVVTNAMTEQAAGSNQIIAAMQHIDDATREVRDGTKNIMEGSKKISVEMDMLAKSTVQTNQNVIRMTQGAEAIGEAIRQGNEATAQNSESIALIAEEIAKFKL